MFIFIFFVNIRKSLFSCMCRTTAPPTTPTQTEASRGSTVLTSCGSQVALSRPDFWMHCRKLFFVAQCHLNFLQIPYPYLQILLHRISWTWNRENANIPKMIFKFMNDVVLVLLETVNLFVLAECECVCVCVCVCVIVSDSERYFVNIIFEGSALTVLVVTLPETQDLLQNE